MQKNTVNKKMLCIGSACFSEIEYLIQRLNAKLSSVHEELWEASSPYGKILLSPLGVGFFSAGLRLQQLVGNFPEIHQILFLGTAGVYPSVETLQVGDVSLCGETLLSDASEVLGKSHFAPPLSRGPILSNWREQIWSSYPYSRVVTLLTLTKDDSLADQIQKVTQGEIENMELFGVAEVCSRHQIPWNAFLGITNVVGKHGSKDWMKNHKTVEKSAAELLCQTLLGC